MKLRQLQCLCAVAEADFNVSRAAVALHATQPAVSKQLRQLEEELGLDLLQRYGGRVIGLTDAGERTLVFGRRALQCVESIRGLTQESRGDSGGSIVLATSHTHAKYVLLPVIRAFTRRYPKVRILVRHGGPEQASDMVREGKATVGVISIAPRDRNDVLAVPFRSYRLVLIAPPGHPVLKVKTLTLERLSGYPFVLIHPSPLGVHVLEKFKRVDLDVDVAVEAVNADMAKDFVGAGLGIALIPSFAYSPRTDRNLRGRDAGHLFDPVTSSILLRRESHLPRYVYDFLETVDATLERRRLDSLIFSQDP